MSKARKQFSALAFGVLCVLLTPAIVRAATFDFIEVEDISNGNDPLNGYGNVDYAYCIGTTEVTNAQYAEFLNAIADDDPNGVWNANMDITRSGSAGSYTYTVVGGFEDHPINQASFFDAMRFVNWVENGQPTGAQDASTTEDGTYLISDGSSEVRSVDATYFLPSEDEWYKAAYYSLDDGDGDPGYWLYPTQSDTAPTAEAPPGGSNSANYLNAVADTTIVGSYTSTTNFYGGFDFGGNVFEWTEGVSGTDRIVRGGSYTSAASTLASTGRTALAPGGGSFEGGVGFRIARTAVLVAVPETSVIGLLLLGASIFWRRGRR